MGVEDSPLRDRVLFVEGAPRSGTTLLVSLLAVHPRIAGVISESQLFSQGVDRLFDNHSGSRGRYQSFLSNYVTEEQLVDLVRQLGDGILERMRERVKPEADWVTEKTPAPPDRAAEVMGRKFQCYPDATYVHIVRDRDATVRSLLKAPWNPRDRAGSEEWWEQAVAAIRDNFGASDRYLELGYDELTGDVPAAVQRVLGFVGLEADPETLARIESMSRERISTFDESAARRPAEASGQPGPRRAQAPPRDSLLAGVGRRLEAWAGRIAAVRERPASRAEDLLGAISERDAAAVEALTADDVLVELRSGTGDLRETGAGGRRALLEIGRALFGGESIGTEWASTARAPMVTILVSNVNSDGTRADASFGFVMQGGRATRVGIIAAGDLAGRRPERWPGGRAGPGLEAEPAPAARAGSG